MEEIWVYIHGFPRYQINNYGEVWNTVFEMFMKPSKMLNGQLKVSLIDEHHIRRSLSVAVLVARAFVEPPNERSDQVILLDGNMENVAAYNLAWRTPRQAYLYARQMRLPPKTPWTNLQVLNQTTGVLYENIIQCGMAEGLVFQHIWESTFKGAWYPEGSRPSNGTYRGERVYPYGHTYEIIKRV